MTARNNNFNKSQTIFTFISGKFSVSISPKKLAEIQSTLEKTSIRDNRINGLHFNNKQSLMNSLVRTAQSIQEISKVRNHSMEKKN